ncbi:MAG: DUF4230 domain-containing protein [Terriglobales bacterium]
MEPEQKQPNRSQRKKVSAVVIGIVILLFIALIGMFARPRESLLELLKLVGSGHIVFNIDQPTVVHQIQQLKRLETISYTMDKIISAERDSPYLPKFLISDRILLIAHGDVIAGVDLAKIQPGDVTVRGANISVRLPAAEVFSTRIDNAKTRAYSRDTGLFSSPDPDLESQVREEAERQLQQAALQDGILNAASQNARTTIAGMLKGLGFQQVEVH